MNQIVNIIDVAKHAGVAKSTVSNVLTGKKFVSEELRQRVLRACEELDYHPNFYASALSSKKTNIIALLLESSSDVEQKMYKNLVAACIKEAAEHNYSILVYYNMDREKILEVLRKGCAPIDGAVMMSPCINDERLAQFNAQHINLVSVGRPESEDKFYYVDVDNVKLTRDTTLKLLACSSIEKDIYLINSDPELTISQDRINGFEMACSKCGIESSGRIFEREMLFNNEKRQTIVEKIKKGSIFITCDDIVAKEIYCIAKDKKLTISEDVSVFSLGRSIDAGTFDPPLSYAKQDYSRLGKVAVSMLVDIMEGRECERIKLIRSEIIIGQSVKTLN